MSASAPPDLLRHKGFGHYEILALLGSGGMGDVYRARDVALGRQVAIKVLHGPLAADPARLGRFEQEARAASALNHPNIVTVYEIGKIDGVPYMAMEMVEGKSLRAILREGPPSTRRVLQLATQVADALAQAHAAGIVHRDLKPENIMVTPEGRVKLLDFGLAKQNPAPVDEDASTGSFQTPETEPGVILGTVRYMSPEQARGLPVDFRSDQFSCGSILYEMTTGQPAFRRPSAVQTLAAIIEDEPEPLASLNPDVPPPLRWIIERCLAKDPGDRYASTRDLARDIESVLNHLSEVSSGVYRATLGIAWTTAWRGPGRWRVPVAALAVSLAAAGLWVSRPRAPSPPVSRGAAVAARKVRRSVAVLGFKDLTGRPGTGWLSMALSEMLTTELNAGGRLRTIPGENIARMKMDLSLGDVESLAADTLAKVGRNLGADLVVLGSYVLLPGDQVRLDLRLQEVASGETVAALGVSGTEAGLVDLVSRAGSQLRGAVGVGEPNPSEAGRLRAAAPASLEGQRLYAEGLARLRVFDALAAKDLLRRAADADPTAPLVHLALSGAWSILGHDAEARQEARRAFDLSGGLSREERLAVEARYRETAAEWEKAIEIYKALYAFFPDNLEYGLRLAAAQTTTGRGREALVTLDGLRRLAEPASQDPRIDLQEAAVAQALGDFKREQAAATHTATKAVARGMRLLLARARLMEAYALGRLGETAKAAAAAEEARAIYAEIGDAEGTASALNRVGHLFWARGDVLEAREKWEESLAIQHRIGDLHGIASAASNLGLVFVEQGDLASARKHFDETLAIDRERGDRPGVVYTLDNLCIVRFEQGELPEASKTCGEALALAREIGERTEEASVLKRLAAIQLVQGDVSAARASYDRALAVLREGGLRDFAADAVAGLGELLQAQGDLAGARKRMEEALAARLDLGDQLAVAKSRLALAALAIDEGRPGEAESSLPGVVEFFGGQKAADHEARARDILARSLLEQGKPDALAAASRALALSSRSQSPHVRLAAAVTTARAVAASGRVHEAAGSLEAALAEAERRGFVGLQLEIRLALGEADIREGRVGEARGALERLRSDAQSHGFGLIARKAGAILGPRVAGATKP